MKELPLILFIIACLSPLSGYSQIWVDCIDSNRVNPNYRCNDPTFDPVCGCNNVTYRNGCEMYNVGGVNYPSITSNGVCSNDYFYSFFYPNPCTDRINFNMQFTDQKYAPVTLQIYSVFGNLMLSQSYTSITSSPSPPITIYLSNLKSGMYTLVIRANGVYKISKFVKLAT
jgi:hypothetical protein